MDNKLELKDFIMYLPYKLPARLSQQGISNLDREYPDSNDRRVGYFNSFYFNEEFSGSIRVSDKTSFDVEEGDFEIILRPLSDLTKEIEYEGKKFVPHDRLQLGFLYGLPRTIQGRGVAENRIVTNTMSYTDWLQCIKWKIDVNDLIGQGKAIDINKI